MSRYNMHIFISYSLKIKLYNHIAYFVIYNLHKVYLIYVFSALTYSHMYARVRAHTHARIFLVTLICCMWTSVYVYVCVCL